jgi:hypothetical protein
MPFEQAVFLRIDTAEGKPYLEGPTSGEMVVATLFGGRDKGWFDLIGFVVLPCELQLMIFPRRVAAGSVVSSLEADLYPTLSVVKPISTTIFDPDFYREKIDMDEELRQRLRWMHLTPVRARLTTLAESYPFSSANARFRAMLHTVRSAS